MNLIPRIAAVFILISSTTWGQTRLAVTADDDSKPLVGLLLKELRKQKDLALISEADVEKKMSDNALAATDPTLLPQLAKSLEANGVLDLEVGKEYDIPVLHVQLYAAAPGIVVADVRLSFNPDNLDDLPGLIAHHIAPLIPKLSLPREKAVPVAIFCVAAPGDDRVSTLLKRDASALLADSIGTQPGLFAITNRRPDLFATGKNEEGERLPAFWDHAWGLYLESTAKEGGDISIRLVLRPPGGTGRDGDKTFTAEGPRKSLRELTASLTRQILDSTGWQASTTAWNPDTRAHQFMQEVVYMWKLIQDKNGDSSEHQYDAPALALEKASALGMDSADLVFLNMWMLAEKVQAGQFFPGDDRERPPQRERYDVALAAIEACNRYLDGRLEKQLKYFNAEFLRDAQEFPARAKVARAASTVLVELTDRPDPQDPPAGPLRHAIRKLEKFDPLAGSLPKDFDEASEFCTYWAESADELAAYYLLHMAQEDPWNKRASNSLVELFVLEREKLFARFPDPAMNFEKFVDALAAKPSTRLAAFLIRSRGSAPVEERKAYYRKFLDEFWTRRDDLAHPTLLRAYIIAADARKGEFHDAFMEQRLRLLRHYLAHSSEGENFVMEMWWNPEIFPPDQVSEIWKEFNGMRLRCAENTKGVNQNISWDIHEKALRKQFPSLKLEVPPADAAPLDPRTFTLTRYWHPYNLPGFPKKNMFFLEGDCMDGKLWLGAMVSRERTGYLFCVDLETFATEYYEIPGVSQPGCIKVTADAVYVNSEQTIEHSKKHECVVHRFDRKKLTWSTLHFPGAFSQFLFVVNDNLYLSLWDLDEKMDTASGGLLRYNCDTAATTILADNHRNPALNQFDNRDGYPIDGVFEGPGKKLCALIDQRLYNVREEAGKWDTLKLETQHPDQHFEAITQDGKTLLYSLYESDFFYIDPEKKEPEKWMGAAGTGLWDKIPDFNQLCWPQFGFTPAGFYILSYTRDKKPVVQLRWYERDGPRAGEIIPLRFQIDDATVAIFASLVTDDRTDPPEKVLHDHTDFNTFHFRIIHAPTGIVITDSRGGFWFTSYADITAHLKKLKESPTLH